MRKFEYANKLLDLIWDKFEALAHPVRLKIILALIEEPMCVCELSGYLSEKQPLISQHLAILKDSGLVEAKRIGNRIQYSISDVRIVDIIKLMEDITIKKLKELVDVQEG
ncbi:MAG: metalloregulator ArsR/SmtB family transcription factor [bacterium]|nr:metalloregulator ArsR/SmtB family transcription factor [bacterium]